MAGRPRVTPRAKQDHARYMRYYMQDRAAVLKRAGLCIICGKRPSRDEKMTCQQCVDKQMRSKGYA